MLEQVLKTTDAELAKFFFKATIKKKGNAGRKKTDFWFREHPFPVPAILMRDEHSLWSRVKHHQQAAAQKLQLQTKYGV